MKVKDIITAEPTTCSPATNLAAAAALMLDADCGILPVVENGKLVGVITVDDVIDIITPEEPEIRELERGPESSPGENQ